ncbi:hypothetical protein QBC37DRAFT_323341 [Rhypophila decipiens]|uniref:3'-5' exonuclease domain-containing protein n=1 Tax=Rhypophila decipiens TaxID=261697 RepID=A0AAN7B4M1_9PEZI|nr:hypothetical protein QBC37DRAFT_323341 [Rhypophila decipiens]
MAEIIASLGRINISRQVRSAPDWSIVDTPEAVSHLVDIICLELVNRQTTSDVPQVPALYIDIQTNDDSSNQGHGSQCACISLLQIYLLPREHIYLVDVQTLGRQGAFETSGPTHGQSLQSLLESETISKVFFDVRTDAEILYHRYGVSLGGVQDLQLMELAARAVSPRSLRHLNSLPRCINRDLNLSILEQITWDKWITLQRKRSQVEMANRELRRLNGLLFSSLSQAGERQHKQEMEVEGAGYQLLRMEKGMDISARPLTKGSETMELIGLVVLNVRYLPGLWEEYERRSRPDASHWQDGNETCGNREEGWRKRVEQGTRERLESARNGQYGLVSGAVGGKGRGKLMMLAPVGWE